MIDTPVTICFVVLQNQTILQVNTTSEQFRKKLTTSMLSGQQCGATVHIA